MLLRILLSGSRFPTIVIDKVSVFTHILLHKGLVCCEIFWLYYIQDVHMKLLDEIHNLHVLINIPNTESGFRIIFKDVSNLPKVIRI